MGTHHEVNMNSCYTTLVYNKLVSLDKDLKDCYISLREPLSPPAIERIKKQIKYFQNEKAFWLKELKSWLDQLKYPAEE